MQPTTRWIWSTCAATSCGGRMPGQWRMRIRYRDLRTPWFDHLTVSGAELGRLLDRTGWRIDRVEQGPVGRYSALLLKEDS